MSYFKLFLILITAVIISSCTHSNIPAYKNPKLPIDERVKDLISRMTLDEKVEQVSATIIASYKTEQLFDSLGNLNIHVADSTFKNGALGHIHIDASMNFTPRILAIATNNLQRYIKKKTRLGIPIIMHDEGLHGNVTLNGTSFSMPMGVASTWDTALVQQLYTMVAKEMRSHGSQFVLSPIVDLGRDPRWGRTEETFGEDPFLVAQIGLHEVMGLQGRDSMSIDSNHVVSTLKHFCHGTPEGGKNTAPANISERELRQNYFYPFKVCVEQGKVGSVMASYNEIDAIPSNANKWLLQTVLRNEWGFKGSVVSDYYAVSRLYNVHFIAKSFADAGRMAINAGVDMELIENECFSHLKELVQSKEVSEEVLDNAVAHVLRHKFMLGLFENPYVNPDKAEQFVGCDANRKLALQCADESPILLKNENNLLPLNTSAIKTIAVIGPNANRTLLGGYSAKPKQFITVLDGIKAKVGDKINVLYSEGCKINKQVNNENVIVSLAENKPMIDEAVQTAKKADVVILAIGSNEALSAEGVDRSDLDMVGSQNDLVKAMVETGKPVIVLLFNGSPLSINYVKDNVPAIFECWYMGQETGTAIADLLFGNVNPSGKLPITIPRSVGTLPDYYSCKPTSKNPWPNARGGYVFTELGPLWPFGYGLSYTTFGYSNLRLEKTSMGKNDSCKVYFTLKNTGKVAGDEIPQLYIRDSIPPVTRPIIELKGFQRVHLEPDESKELSFQLTPDLLSIWNQDMKFAVNSGPYAIMIGASSDDIKLRKVLIVK